MPLKLLKASNENESIYKLCSTVKTQINVEREKKKRIAINREREWEERECWH